MEHFDFLIVGCGFSGAVVAERLATQYGKSCLVIDRRDHIAGNCYDYYDEAGVLVHRYGPHYFRTNSDQVIAYLSKFTDWHEVEYKVLSWTDGQYWSFPINLKTFEQFIGRPSTSEEMISSLAAWKVPIENPQNSEEIIVSQVGWAFYEKFFKNYTIKQWKRDPKDLDSSVCGRIPIRTNRDDRYLTDRFQAMPKEGYTRMFEQMLDHELITVRLETDLASLSPSTRWSHMVYTGPIDEYFKCQFGALPYRSLRFEHESINQEFFQPAMQVNYPNDHDFTRIVEIKHATGQKLDQTTIVREYPEDYISGREPYYPIPAADTKALYERYAQQARALPDVTFLGRLATYRYYNMDQVIAIALQKVPQLAGIDLKTE